MTSKLYDPKDYAAMGPQITARPGTKRHSAQCRARAAFFAVMAGNADAKLQRLLDTSACYRAPSSTCP
jgi:hypothetical protein